MNRDDLRPLARTCLQAPAVTFSMSRAASTAANLCVPWEKPFGKAQLA